MEHGKEDDGGDIEEGEIQGACCLREQEALHSEFTGIGYTTSHRQQQQRNFDSLSPPSSHRYPQRRSMSRRYRPCRDRREFYRERDHVLGRTRDNGTNAGYRTERSSYETAQEREILLQETHDLSKRCTLHDATTSLDTVCRLLKAAIKKLDKARRLPSKRNDHLDLVECERGLFSGLRAVHCVCSDRLVKVQNWEIVIDVMSTAMNHRHVLFAAAQRREIEDWTRDLERLQSGSSDRLQLTAAKTITRVNEPRRTLFSPADQTCRSQIRPQSSDPELKVQEQRPRSQIQEVTTIPSIPNTEGSEESTKVFRIDTETSNQIHTLSNSTALFGQQRLCSTGQSEENKKMKDGLNLVETSDRKQDEVSGSVSGKELCRDGTSTSVTPVIAALKPHCDRPNRDLETDCLEKSSVKKQRITTESVHLEMSIQDSTCNFMAVNFLETSAIDSVTASDMNAIVESCKLQISTPDAKQRGNSLGNVPCQQIESEKICVTPPFTDQRRIASASEEVEDAGIEGTQRGVVSGWSETTDLTRESRLHKHADCFGLKSVRYTPTESNSVVTDDQFIGLAIPPPPPPLIFKPKPISPDVTFDPQSDAYWESLLHHAPYVKSSQTREVCEMLEQGKMCLVLDLDTVLFSSTKFSELDSESTKLLQSCLENEAHLPFFAQSLHCIHSLNMWLKLRPGLNKFLRVAHHAFRFYGYTSRAKEEVEVILKIIDPDGWIRPDRVVYHERAPGESIFKRINSLGASFQSLNSVTLILSDSCLPWEEMDAVMGIESYLFFPETKAVFGLTSPSMFETRTDEEDCGFLLNTLGILLLLRQQSFQRMAEPSQEEKREGAETDHQLPQHFSLMNTWDMRRLIAEERILLMPDVFIMFDRVLSPNEPQEQQILWRMASSMGAHCSLSYTNETTHVITLPNSSKIAWARSRGCHVVSPVWLEASYVLWFRLSEECYAVREV